MRADKKQLVAITWKEGKYFVAQCLNVDVSSFGKTKREALENLKEAVELYFEDATTEKAENIERKSVSVESLAYV